MDELKNGKGNLKQENPSAISPRTSRLAIASLIMSPLGFFPWIFNPIIYAYFEKAHSLRRYLILSYGYGIGDFEKSLELLESYAHGLWYVGFLMGILALLRIYGSHGKMKGLVFAYLGVALPLIILFLTIPCPLAAR